MEFINYTGAIGLNLIGSAITGCMGGLVLGSIYMGIRWIVLKVKKQKQQ